MIKEFKNRILPAVAAVAAVALLRMGALAAEPAAGAADSTGQVNLTGGEVIPVIQMEGAALTSTLESLGRQSGINFQFDPRIVTPTVTADGRTNALATVTFRFENVTAAQAFFAVLDNYGLQFLSDPRTKIGRVTLKDAAAAEPLVSRIVNLKFTQATNIVALVQPLMGQRSRVLPDPRTGQLVVFATEKELATIEDFVRKLDRSLPQFMIEARFLETSKNPRSAKGLDWSDTLSAQRLTFGNSSLVTAAGGGGGGGASVENSSSALPRNDALSSAPRVLLDTAKGFNPNIGILSAEGVRATLSFLNSDSDTESLATPRAVTMEGIQTELSVVRNVPVFEESLAPGGAGGAPASAVKPNYDLSVGGRILNEVGIKLLVTPRMQGDSNIFLDLKPEISDQELTPAIATLSGKQSTAPIFSRRRLTTQAVVPDGHTLVLGGLVSDSKSDVNSKVPLLGDIPGLGAAFRKNSKERNKRNLVMFVTPTIISKDDYQDGQRPTEFFKTSSSISPDEPKTVWNSAKAEKDWTKPKAQ